MNKNKKIVLITGILLIIVVCVILGLSIYNKKNKELKNIVIINENENFKQSREYEKLTLSNVEFKYEGEESEITGTLTNNSEEKIEEIMLRVILVDKQKNQLGTVFLYTEELEAKSSKELKGSIDKNYIDADDYYIEY